MVDDKKTALRWLDREGWDVDTEGSRYTATHPDAAEPIIFGGRSGWSLSKIRRDAQRALGIEVKTANRRRTEREAARQQRAEETARLERENDRALRALIRAERRERGATAKATSQLLDEARRVGALPGWTVSPHACQRMRERGVTAAELRETIRHPLDVSLDRDRPIYAGPGVLAVVDAIDRVVVTVYRGTLAQHRARMPERVGT
ncbi:DUF4258 domain-containing protein [Nocardioides sp. ChNu-99]|uniref:DUF4258 domain-containing protein n=1 Tax=Nocardioides sp. ChNu-99 TaxID=2839897 RepID=UPI0024075BE0|nr:DUF4258 domain-containing protein [Nocardioides sp. ChNu-99]MDF9717382.1 DUF4258 domain-containing protein [Nocardioides sp. ChNu-99]